MPVSIIEAIFVLNSLCFHRTAEVAAFLLDHKRFAGVPPTTLVPA